MRPRAILGGLVLVAWVAKTAPLLACPICFQVEQGPVTDGVRAAVVVLVAVTMGVLAGFGAFIRGFVQRAHRLDAGGGHAANGESRP